MRAMLKNQTGRFRSFFRSLSTPKTLEEVPFLDGIDPKAEQAALVLLGGAAWAGKVENPQALEKFTKILATRFPAAEIDELIEKSKNATSERLKAAAVKLKNNPAEKHIELLRAIIAIASGSDGFNKSEQQYFKMIAEEFGIAAEDVLVIEKSVLQRGQKKQRLIKSGAGIIAALFVLLLFILTATLLQSLLFGLILAYISLPIEKWFERRLDKGGMLHFVSRILGNVRSSIDKITSKHEFTEEQIEQKNREQLVARATTATLLTVSLFGLGLIVLFTVISMHYVSGGLRSYKTAKNQIREQQKGEDTANKKENSSTKEAAKSEDKPEKEKEEADDVDSFSIPASVPFSSEIKYWIDKLEAQKPRFEKLPIIRDAIDYASQALQDEKFRKEMINMALKKSGGVISMTTGIVSRIVIFLLNLLLTFFFFSLLLRKMAASVNSGSNTAEQQDSYIVKSIINSEWMPEIREDTLKDAQRIISEVINKLKAWLRGYLTLVVIDSAVYTTVFVLLGVPYAVILGIIAGMGVLLPYIGPVASASLTVLVCLVTGDASMLKIVAIVFTYLIQNGIVEQFFLYPAVIGGRLGLTTLETIIVVLLGALFGGITGMIFALPATSVMKYLIQQIYGWWSSEPHI
ncbi:MAG: AI-2E family transporter [Victivallaceae bacterium]|nr:AI-2E family transporter [Victivallaceae bacterium]MDD4181262.1 AI-2E family transporter [Victivallaceae bacterium]